MKISTDKFETTDRVLLIEDCLIRNTTSKFVTGAKGYILPYQPENISSNYTLVMFDKKAKGFKPKYRIVLKSKLKTMNWF